MKGAVFFPKMMLTNAKPRLGTQSFQSSGFCFCLTLEADNSCSGFYCHSCSNQSDGLIVTFRPFLSSVFRRWNQKGIFSTCGNAAICHWHDSDWIYTDAGNNLNHLLHRSDVLMHVWKKKQKQQNKPNSCCPLVKSKILNPYMPRSNKGLNLAFPKSLLAWVMSSVTVMKLIGAELGHPHEKI